jgi:putative RecB family exonuclease
MPMYSHSRLTVYETCPRQYRYQYVDKVPVPEVRTVEMFVGSQVHSALESLYTQVKREVAPALDAVLDGYRKRWTDEWTEDILIRREGTSADDYRLQGEGYIAAYYRRYHPFDGERTVAVERRVMFPLAEERKIWLQGYVDRISVTREGLWQIHDYKTGRWVPTQEDLDRDRQMALYQIGIQRDLPREATRIGFDQARLSAGCRRSVESLPACARLRAACPAPDACPWPARQRERARTRSHE